MTTITDNPERRALEALGQSLPRPATILCISAHWETTGATHVSDGPAPRTIHDFRGFPQELYEIHYAAPGSRELIGRIEDVLPPASVTRDATWGFDHGVWGVLRPMYPEANIPVVAMSLNRSLDAAGHLALGKALGSLRHHGVMIVGSGNVVHNLALWRASAGTRPEWASEFQSRINRAMQRGDEHALSTFAASDEAAIKAVNSAEHYLPLLYVAGARLPGDELTVFNDTIDGTLSMTSYVLNGSVQ